MKLARISGGLAAALLALLSACASTGPQPPTAPEQIGEVRPGMLKGYLDRKALPDSLGLLPPPPAVGWPLSSARVCCLTVHGRFPSRAPWCPIRRCALHASAIVPGHG